MTAVENLSPPPPPPPPPLADDDQLYHSDDVGLRDTPPLEPKKVNLQPSPSPPLAIPSPEVTPDSSPEPPDRKRPDRDATRHRRRQRPRNRPSQGDAVLVHFMDGGKWPDVAQIAGQEPLPSDDDDEEGDDAPAPRRVTAVDNVVEKDVGNSLAAIAAGALAHQGQAGQAAQELPTTRFPQDGGAAAAAARRVEGEPVDGVKTSIPPIASTYTGDARRPPSPDASIKPEAMTPSTGGLPPIRQHSPKSHLANGNGTGPITLPSISDQLRDLNHLAEAVPTGDSPFPQSPPSRPPHLYPAAPTHGSPPKSPNDTFRRGLPSPSGPGHYYYAQTNHQRIAQADTTQYANAGEYSSSNTETPSTDQSVATPALPIDRMSIDGITNPQVGGYQCSYPGCTAQPFQTQYLLNSHRNVHSSIRPHYCPVKGCPRSEGGKGFKRKNEMIRHGLVHDSPGYVCPFCPDREHKYPRPDNLQRHVRVHHVDRDKDDPQLRDVLAQRPEGPNRGRRRRGAPS